MTTNKRPKFKEGQDVFYYGNLYTIREVFSNHLGHFYYLHGRIGMIAEPLVKSAKKLKNQSGVACL